MTEPPSEPSGSDPWSGQPPWPTGPVPSGSSSNQRRRRTGVGVGLLGYLVALLIASAGAGREGGEYVAIAYGIFAIGMTVALTVTGLVLLVFDNTRAVGVGLLIAVPIGVLVGGGVCIGIAAAG